MEFEGCILFLKVTPPTLFRSPHNHPSSEWPNSTRRLLIHCAMLATQPTALCRSKRKLGDVTAPGGPRLSAETEILLPHNASPSSESSPPHPYPPPHTHTSSSESSPQHTHNRILQTPSSKSCPHKSFPTQKHPLHLKPLPYTSTPLSKSFATQIRPWKGKGKRTSLLTPEWHNGTSDKIMCNRCIY